MRKTSKQFGFTLLELLIIVGIVAIILLFAIPSQKSFLSQTNDKIMSSQLLRAINLTRSEAATRGKPVILCKSNDSKSCMGDWKNGYIIISDNEVLFSFQNNMNGKLHWRMFPAHRDDLQFLPSGLPFSENGTFWYCEKPSVKPSWAIMVSRSGRARIVFPDAEGEIIDSGTPLTCAV